VVVPEERRRAWAEERGVDEVSLRGIEARQLSGEEKAKRSDQVVQNDEDLDRLREQAEELGRKVRGEDPAVAYDKRRRYGRSRFRRQRGAVVLVVLAGILAALPFVLRAPEEVRKAVYPLRYEETIREASEEYGLEPAFVAGVVYTESRFRPDAESHREAYGLMQLLPQTAEFIGQRSGIKATTATRGEPEARGVVPRVPRRTVSGG
jgi:hypothetical protein